MNYKKNSIVIILGTRAELIKLFPVMRELEKRKIPYHFIHSGQHSLSNLCTLFGVKKPDIIITPEPKESSKFNSNNIKAIFWSTQIVRGIRKELRILKNLKWVVYHGDTITTTAAALASSKMLNPFKAYKNVHLEAGLRSWNNKEPFPEEFSRRIVGRFSDVLITPSKKSTENLKHLKKKEILHLGNTIVDSAYYALSLAKKKKIKPIARGRFCLVTIHRHENLKNLKRMEKIVEILSSLSIPTYFAVHDNTMKKLKEFGLVTELNKNKNIHIIKPLDYVRFIYNMKKASLIVCDGGSMQEESLIFAKPCIILRKATERPEGLESNFQFLSKLDVEKTKEKIKEYLSPRFKIKPYKNPYGEVGLSKHLMEILKR